MNRTHGMSRWLPVATVALLTAMNGCADVEGTSAEALTGRVEVGASVTYSQGDCAIAAVPFLVPVARVRSAVPSRYNLFAVAGHAIMMVASYRCTNPNIDPATGSATTDVLVSSDIGVRVVPQDGTPAPHIYLLSHYDNEQNLRQSLSRLGLPAHLVQQASAEVSTDVPGTAGTFTGNFPWDEGAYSVSASFIAPPTSPTFTVPGIVWWHDGRAGRVKNSMTFANIRPVRPLTATLNFAEGSEYAFYAGNTSVSTTTASYYRTTVNGTATLIEGR